MDYSPSTIARIGDIKNGLLVQTSREVSYLSWGVGVQASLFTVHNRIFIHALWAEVGVTALVGAGALMLFNFASTVPVVAAVAMNAVCTTIHGFVRGRRISLAGVSAATAVNVDGAAGISFGYSAPVVVGIEPSATVASVGQIGCLTSIAVLTVGTARFSVIYTPIDPGAYVEALL